MPAFYAHHTGAVVSFAISKFVYVITNPKFDGHIRVSYSQTENVEGLDELKHDLVRETLRYFRVTKGIEVVSVSDIPGKGSGLGSSSSFIVGLANALGRGTTPGILAERAFDIEANLCHHPVGKQDHYAASYGGMNFIKFQGKQVTVRPLYYSQTFADHCLLLWTGRTRDANPILKEQGKMMAGASIQSGMELARLALDFHNEYTAGMTPKRIGEFVYEGWKIKAKLSGGISDSQIDEWIAVGMSEGAYGGKLLGAGGGGFLFFVAPPEIHFKIIKATGLRCVDFKIESEGSKVIYG